MAIPVGYSRAVLSFTGNNAPTGAVCVFCIQNIAGDSPSAIAVQIAAAWDLSGIEAAQSDDIAMTQVDVKNGPDATGPSGSAPANVVGDSAGTSAPPNTAFLIHKSTAAGGRRGRGRMFIPGVPDAAVGDNGVLLGTSVTTLQNGVNAFLTSLDGAGYPMHLEHGPSTHWVLVNGQPRRVPDDPNVFPTPTEVTALTVDPIAGTIRRRMRR